MCKVANRRILRMMNELWIVMHLTDSVRDDGRARARRQGKTGVP